MIRLGLPLTGGIALKLLSVSPGVVIVRKPFVTTADVTFFYVRRPACVRARVSLVLENIDRRTCY